MYSATPFYFLAVFPEPAYFVEFNFLTTYHISAALFLCTSSFALVTTLSLLDLFALPYLGSTCSTLYTFVGFLLLLVGFSEALEFLKTQCGLNLLALFASLPLLQFDLFAGFLD